MVTLHGEWPILSATFQDVCPTVMGTKRKFAGSVLEDAKPHRRSRLTTQAEPEKCRLPTQDTMKAAPLISLDVSDAAFVAIPRSPTVEESPVEATLLETNPVETNTVETNTVETEALETTPSETEPMATTNGETQPVEVNATSISISRPLEPTPAIHTLPVDESFCPSGFNMLEVLVKRPSICFDTLGKSTDD